MQYFKEHAMNDTLLENNKNIISGKLIKKDYNDYYIEKDYNDYYIENYNDYYIENYTESSIINNRGIIEDEVYIDINTNEVIGIKNRNLNYIIGILDITSKIKYGSYKDKMLYLFRPTDKNITHFYIPYAIKSTNNKKIYVVIQFKEWKTTDKLPIGLLIENIGEVGNIDVEYEHLRYLFNIKNNNYKLDNDKRINDSKIISELQNNVSDYEVFSIDPLGSTDIDDAFHFIDINDSSFEFGIHIASPFLFFENDIEKILDRVSTVYLPNKKYNMLPNIYADNLLSLLEGENRFAISIVLIIDKFTNEIININIKETIVKNIKNYDYESFDELYKRLYTKLTFKVEKQEEKKIEKQEEKEIKEEIEIQEEKEKIKIDKKLKRLTDIERNIFNCMINSAKFFGKELEYFDSHKLVELWMIKANKIIAQYLIDLKLTNTIVRTNLKSDYNGLKDNFNKEMDNKLLEYLSIKEQNSATYEIYNYQTEVEKQTHYTLGDEYYTHFTSPIRRAIDLFIHGLIIKKTDLLFSNKLEKYLEKINIFNKNNRKFTRQLKRLEFLNNIKISGQSGNIITYGYIIKITNYKLKIYMPEYNLEESIIIIPYKFKDIAIYNIELNNDVIKSIEYSIDNNLEQEQIFKKYTLYERVNIKLWIFMSFDNIYDKLKIEIIV